MERNSEFREAESQERGLHAQEMERDRETEREKERERERGDGQVPCPDRATRG